MLCFAFLGAAPRFVVAQIPVGSVPLRLSGGIHPGMAGAATAMPAGAEGVWTNPATLTWQPKSEIIFGTTLIRPATTYLAETPSVYLDTTFTNLITPIYLALCWRPGNGSKSTKWAYGLGINSPFWNFTRWPENWKGRLVVEEYSVRTLFVEPTVSYRLTQRLSIGGGPLIALGNWFEKKALSYVSTSGEPTYAEHNAIGSGAGYNLSLYYRASDKIALGLSYRSKISLQVIRGEARFLVPVSLSPDFPDQNFESVLTFPAQLTGGLCYMPSSRVSLDLDIEWLQWSKADSTFVNYDQQTLYVRNRTWSGSFQDVIAFRMGIQYNLSELLSVQTGFSYSPTPVPRAYLSPAFPDANRVRVAAGLRWNITPKISVDGSISQEFTGERTGFLTGTGFGGTYASTITALNLGLRYGF